MVFLLGDLSIIVMEAGSNLWEEFMGCWLRFCFEGFYSLLGSLIYIIGGPAKIKRGFGFWPAASINYCLCWLLLLITSWLAVCNVNSCL